MNVGPHFSCFALWNEVPHNDAALLTTSSLHVNTVPWRLCVRETFDLKDTAPSKFLKVSLQCGHSEHRVNWRRKGRTAHWRPCVNEPAPSRYCAAWRITARQPPYGSTLIFRIFKCTPNAEELKIAVMRFCNLYIASYKGFSALPVENSKSPISTFSTLTT